MRPIRKIVSNAAEGGDEHDEITTENSVISPAHYVFKIESFSLLSKSGTTIYETNEFIVGDQKWRLILYPNGDKSKKGEDHVSLYVAVSEASLYVAVSEANPLRLGREINATVRFFVFDQIRDEYLVKEGKNRRFHAMKSKWGIPRFMPLKTFINPSNGYLVDDTCVFGVEVFVVKSLGLGECLSLKASPETFNYEWKISNFSTLVNDCYSEVFTVGNLKWKLRLYREGKEHDRNNMFRKLRLYRRGEEHNRNNHLEACLCLVDSGDQKVKANYTIRFTGKAGKVHLRTALNVWFSSSAAEWGWSSFMPLKMVPEHLNYDGSCVIGAVVTVLGTVSKLP